MSACNPVLKALQGWHALLRGCRVSWGRPWPWHQGCCENRVWCSLSIWSQSGITAGAEPWAAPEQVVVVRWGWLSSGAEADDGTGCNWPGREQLSAVAPAPDLEWEPVQVAVLALELK